MSSTTTAFVNADIHAETMVLEDHAVIVSNGRIEDIVPREALPSDVVTIDLGGNNLAAGFVDLQVNGGAGILLNDAYSEDDVLKVLQAHQALGATSIFPTIFTSPPADMRGLLSTVVGLRKKGFRGVAGIHFEGPVIDGSKAGVHERQNIRGLDEDLAKFFMDAAGSLPVLVTLAPERVNDAQIQALRRAGVLVFAGHTNADYARMRNALSAGLQGGTHLFNAMSAFGSREPGVVGSLLAETEAFVSVIADGHHVHWASLRAAWQCKRPGKLFCVTDAMPCVGSDLTEFRLGGLDVYVRNGRCETSDGTLAGSALDMAAAVRNLVQRVGVPLPEALRMANAYPAEFAGLKDVGRLRKGVLADLVVFDNQLHVSAVYLAGDLLKR